MSRYWMEDLGTFALALDGHKSLVRSVSSNPGHLLWSGLPSRAAARATCLRLMQDDLFSGWGLRTLSARNGGFNPLSYQLGSVWPHDTLIAAAGFWRYGFHDEAFRLIHAVLEAASRFENKRLPELFCGTDRAHGLPVPYLEANCPQAWAAAAPILAVQLFLGLVPDAPRKRCVLAPRLPEWLGRLEVRGIELAGTRMNVTVVRQGDATVIEKLEAEGLRVSEEPETAALWGLPPERR
jgi:glycogen debranching enzyme